MIPANDLQTIFNIVTLSECPVTAHENRAFVRGSSGRPVSL